MTESPDADTASVDETPSISCTQCGREWVLEYELDELHAGNRAVEQFALDHQRHTGHYPDGVTPWIAECVQCPEVELYLAERPARRWARTHARHTRHELTLQPPRSEASPETVLGP